MNGKGWRVSILAVVQSQFCIMIGRCSSFLILEILELYYRKNNDLIRVMGYEDLATVVFWVFPLESYSGPPHGLPRALIRLVFGPNFIRNFTKE
jgi:hypothetical protein